MEEKARGLSFPIRRRSFLAGLGALTGTLVGRGLEAGGRSREEEERQGAAPWYKRTLRLGQTNITEVDPPHYDIAWWRRYWKRTRVQGVIINAGGIVAYYPSRHPLHHRALRLGGRDLFGELAEAAHEDGLVVLARMDSNRAHEDFFRARPEWFARDASGKPYRAGELYITCIHTGYYEEYIPQILREIIERSRPEGFADNSWSGLDLRRICYCDACRRRFREATGLSLPERRDWRDERYREWIEWNFRRRLEIWDLNNRAVKEAGGPDCLWIGMLGGSFVSEAMRFRDLKAICERAEYVLLDHQARRIGEGFEGQSDAGHRIHGVLGWNKHVAESMAMYNAGSPTFRHASKPAAEARLWMLDGFAGGLGPWWHHVGAYHEDRRMYRTAEPVNRWHAENERYLAGREPVAEVGLVWSRENAVYFGRDEAGGLVESPYRGYARALVRARIPYVAVHADLIDREIGKLSALILPNLAAVTDEQAAAIRRFVEQGGGLVATGLTSLFDGRGDPRADFAFADLFGVSARDSELRRFESPARRWMERTEHSYLRIHPELRARVDGPHRDDEPPVEGERHEVLRGFDETNILPFGGRLASLETEPGVLVPLTFVPPFPIYPPETGWMRTPRTSIPGLVLNENPGRGRVAFLAADLDHRFARHRLPDHGRLLAALAVWAARGRRPFIVEGPGLVDCRLFRRGRESILHLVNVTAGEYCEGPVDEILPVGPLRVRVAVAARGREASRGVRFLVSRRTVSCEVREGWVEFTVPRVDAHEVAVVS